MRPIDADAYIAEQSEGTFLPDITIEKFNSITPTLDVKPVVHGRWVSYPHQIDRECSICGHTEPYKFADKDAKIFNFCPHCGADMRKEQT